MQHASKQSLSKARPNCLPRRIRISAKSCSRLKLRPSKIKELREKKMCVLGQVNCTSCHGLHMVRIHRCRGLLDRHPGFPTAVVFHVKQFCWSPSPGCDNLIFHKSPISMGHCHTCRSDEDEPVTGTLITSSGKDWKLPSNRR